MNFLPDVWIECEICKGTRYTRETQEVLWKGHSIHDILEMTIEDAAKFFVNQRKIHRILQTLVDVGFISYVVLPLLNWSEPVNAPVYTAIYTI